MGNGFVDFYAIKRALWPPKREGRGGRGGTIVNQNKDSNEKVKLRYMPVSVPAGRFLFQNPPMFSHLLHPFQPIDRQYTQLTRWRKMLRNILAFL